MDPNATLSEIRALLKQPLTHGPADRLAELFEALDDWLTCGGFLPAAWCTVSRPAARVYWEAT